MADRLRRDQSLLLFASGAAFLLWMVPIGRLVLLPLVYLNTHIHELCHALAAIATGGSVKEILVYQDGSGLTPVFGGWLPVVASAGYVGSSLVGAAMIFFSRSERGARATLIVLAVSLSLSMILYVRGDWVGVVSGFAWIGILIALAKFLKPGSAIFASQFIGVMQCLNAGYSILTLLKITAVTEIQSDAALMQKATMVPAMVWAVCWAALSLILLVLTLLRAWNHKPKS